MYTHDNVIILGAQGSGAGEALGLGGQCYHAVVSIIIKYYHNYYVL